MVFYISCSFVEGDKLVVTKPCLLGEVGEILEVVAICEERLYYMNTNRKYPEGSADSTRTWGYDISNNVELIKEGQMTKRIPQVGDKYKCVVEGWDAPVGETVTITMVEDDDFYLSVRYSCEKGSCWWGFTSYPNDFEYIPETQQFERPPIGLTPIHIADGASVADILEAMLKCVKAGKVVDREWLAELIEKLKTN